MDALLDPSLLRSFVAVVEAGGFSAAARQLGVSQSTVSQHMARLEAQTGRRLLARDTHSVTTTPDGDAVLPFAKRALEANAGIRRYLQGGALRGRVRFGASEDFVFSALPEVLADFTARHAEVDLELTVGLSEVLYDRFDAGQLDLILAKRREGDMRGRRAWVDDLRWVGRLGVVPDAEAPLPLVIYPPPSMTRQRALAVLDGVGRRWRVACTSGSLSGLRAAAMAGLGVVPLAAQLIPPGLAELPPCGLPTLGPVEFMVLGGSYGGRDAVTTLGDVLLASAGRLRGG
ncbi:LysR family transcriptional regulator [Acidocella sp.]|uniref:LysR family transcriptional regulator n=1 Tax=Acidocella sp. TaxID=50710 RepID=UPI003D066CE1